MPGREADFRSDLKIAIQYALGLHCPRYALCIGCIIMWFELHI